MRARSGSAPSAAAIRSALDLFEARAQFDGPERAVNTRVAEHAGRLYLDLADEHWRAVAIGPDGRRVPGCPPVRFRRAPGMLPLPVPERGGSIEALQSFLNLSNQNDFVLVVAWPLAALRSSGPYPLLAISGCTLPLASGGSFAVRQLYTDDEEVLFKAARPILLNGIEDIIGRSDLADRAILLTLGPIGEEQRRSETELWREFELARPAILGALLDAAAHGLRAWVPFISAGCREWPTSRSGPRPAKQVSSPPAPSLAPTQPTARPRREHHRCRSDRRARA